VLVIGNIAIDTSMKKGLATLTQSSAGMIVGYLSNPVMLNISINATVNVSTYACFNAGGIIGMVYN